MPLTALTTQALVLSVVRGGLSITKRGTSLTMQRTMARMEKLWEIWRDVCDERELQEEKWGQYEVVDVDVYKGTMQSKPVGGSCASPEMPSEMKALILGEEFGEVCHAVLEARPLRELRAELVQVAAVAVAWIEALDDAAPS